MDINSHILSVGLHEKFSQALSRESHSESVSQKVASSGIHNSPLGEHDSPGRQSSSKHAPAYALWVFPKTPVNAIDATARNENSSDIVLIFTNLGLLLILKTVMKHLAWIT